MTRVGATDLSAPLFLSLRFSPPFVCAAAPTHSDSRCETLPVVRACERQRQDWPRIVVESRRLSPMTIPEVESLNGKCRLGFKEELSCISDCGCLPATMKIGMSNH